MSSINVNALLQSAEESQKSRENYVAQKSVRIKECIQKFNKQCDDLIFKYFDDNDDQSINRSLERAVKKSGNTDRVDLYMNFDREDFKGWAKFVPFKADEYGRNYNARPATCLSLFLQRAKHLGYLPKISFDVWGNKKFTVKFTLDFNEKDVFCGDADIDDELHVSKDSDDQSKEGSVCVDLSEMTIAIGEVGDKKEEKKEKCDSSSV